MNYDICMYVCMYGWKDGWMDGWMDTCMHACMDRCLYICVHVHKDTMYLFLHRYIQNSFDRQRNKIIFYNSFIYYRHPWLLLLTLL